MGKYRIFSIALIAAAVIAAVVAYPYLPAKSATHWNAMDEPDGFAGREMAAFALPVVMLVLFAVFLVLPQIDPFRANYRLHEKEYDGFIVVLMAFMLYIQLAMLAYNVGIGFGMGQAVILGIAGLFYYIGTIMPRIRRNFFFGIRTPWTIVSDRVWKKTHELGGFTFKLNAAIMLLALLLPKYFIVVVLFPILLNMLGLVVYSYLEFKKTVKNKPWLNK
ncbi:MAG: SdpI family protein [Candidatus Micrarchaeota archaeon]